MTKPSIKLDNPLDSTAPTSRSQTSTPSRSTKKERTATPKISTESQTTDLWGGKLKQLGAGIPTPLAETFAKRMRTLGCSTAHGVAVAVEELLKLEDDEIKLLAAEARAKRSIAQIASH